MIARIRLGTVISMAPSRVRIAEIPIRIYEITFPSALLSRIAIPPQRTPPLLPSMPLRYKSGNTDIPFITSVVWIAR